MDDITPSSSSTSLPPPPQTSAGAPGQQQYDNPTSNGQSNQAHMPPPPLPPVVIPQNNNPIPTAMASPMSGFSGMMSPSSAGGSVRRAAPEPNKRALYVGGLDPRVTEDVLRQIFETTGHVQNVKIIPDKNVGPSQVFISMLEKSSPKHCVEMVLLWCTPTTSVFGVLTLASVLTSFLHYQRCMILPLFVVFRMLAARFVD